MELLIVIAIGAAIIWWFFFRNKKVDNDATQAPYKVETPTSDVSRTENKLDPVAIALDLEPMIITKPNNGLDVNQDGKVDLKDAVQAVKNTKTRVKKAADVDGDGRVTVKDAKAAVKKVTRGRKPKSNAA